LKISWKFSDYGKTFDDCLENLDKVLQRCEEKHLVLNGKSLLHPQPMRVGTHHPQPMKMDFLLPKLSKIGQITP
jgi:hypothetical protein